MRVRVRVLRDEGPHQIGGRGGRRAEGLEQLARRAAARRVQPSHLVWVRVGVRVRVRFGVRVRVRVTV